MSEDNKEEFEKKFQAAISEGLRSVKVSSELRSRILERLEAEPRAEIPSGITEESLSDFQGKLSRAVHRTTQEWAAEDEVVLRTESGLSREMGRNVLSERAIVALSSEQVTPEELLDFPDVEEKKRFVEALRGEVRRTTLEKKAPQLARRRVVKALEKEMGSERAPGIASFVSKRTWRRGLSALTSLAAGFAVVFITVFGSADAALASSVRADHQHCCRAAHVRDKAPKGSLEAMVESKFGKVPVPDVDSSWVLRVSRVCLNDEGKPMVHFLYSRSREADKVETMSFHFIPTDQEAQEKLDLRVKQATEISDSDDFPVLGWLDGNWVCTVCSNDMSADELRHQASR